MAGAAAFFAELSHVAGLQESPGFGAQFVSCSGLLGSRRAAFLVILLFNGAYLFSQPVRWR